MLRSFSIPCSFVVWLPLIPKSSVRCRLGPARIQTAGAAGPLPGLRLEGSSTMSQFLSLADFLGSVALAALSWWNIAPITAGISECLQNK
jgi:hypothetical protein